MSVLPTGWRSSSVADVAELVRGVTYGKSDAAATSAPGTIPLLRATNIQPGVLDYDDPVWVAANVVKPQQRLVHGDILIASSSGSSSVVGKSARVTEPVDATFGAFCTVVRPHSIHPAYLAYFLQSPVVRDAWSELARGTNINNLKPSAVAATIVPVPPIEEQQRIVEILDDHFSRLDEAMKDLLPVVGLLDRLRLAVQYEVFSALLTDRTVPLIETLSHSIGGIWGGEPGSDEVDVCVLRVTELKRHGRLDSATAARRSVGVSQFQSRALQTGDLLLEKSGGGPNNPVGRVGLVPSLDEPSVCSNFMQLMRPDTAVVQPRFLHLYLNYFHASGGTVSLQTASTNIRNIKTKDYLKIPVPVPCLVVQERVVGNLDRLLSDCDSLESTVMAGVTRSDSLRRSLLHAAFTGQLTKEFRNG